MIDPGETRTAAQRIRILHVLDKLSVDGATVHGPGRQIAYRVEHYDADRYPVRVCSLRADREAADALRGAGLEVVCLGRSKFDMRALTDLHGIVKAWQPHILHLHGYASWFLGRIAGGLSGVRIVIQEHFTDPGIPVYQSLADRLLGSRQNAALAVSEVVRTFMRERRHVRTADIRIIPNGVPVGRIRDSARRHAGTVRRALGIGEDVAVVGIVGRLAEEKGHECFLRAAARILDARSDAAFLIVGDGPLRRRLEQLAHDLDVAESVHFVDHQPDVTPYFAAMDVSVIASVNEGFASVGIESLAAGTPLVVSDLEAFRSLYIDGHNAVTFPPGRPEHLADAVLRVLDDPMARQRFLANAEDLLKRCDIGTIAERYLELYEGLLADGRG